MNEGPTEEPPARDARTKAKLTAQIRVTFAKDETLEQNLREITRAHLAARDTCKICGGSGEGPLASDYDCEQCNGAGTIPRSLDCLSSELKAWCKEVAVTSPCDALHREIVFTALDLVDWGVLADDYVREEIARLD